MGEIAEMMLDGTLDCVTGEYIGGACGYPRTFEGRRRKSGYERNRESVPCPERSKRMSKIGLIDHIRDVHGHTRTGG